nr:helix-turn-helix domain-containing protein [Lachnospiraceae bacterium]
MRQNQMSMYRLAKASEVPYATLNDICNGRTRLEKCSVETVYRLARSLNVSMEDLIAPYLLKRPNFENFKSTVCHRVKSLGDIAFILDTLERQDIRTYYDRKWYPESLYLLAMLDYLSRENDVPLCDEYDDLRLCKLEKPVYPAGIRAVCVVSKDDTAMKQAAETAIPEFARFNIMENEVRDVV